MTASVAALLLSAAALGRASVAPPDPIDAQSAQWRARGFVVKESLSRAVPGRRLAAVVYAATDGAGDRLETYVVLNGQAYLGYSHPARTERLEIVVPPRGRGFDDWLGDGSRLLAYRSTVLALNASTLNLLLYKGFKFRLAASFPEGRFEPDGRRALIVSRDLPLGRFLSVGCEDFGTISQTAFRTRLYAPVRGRFAEVTKDHPEFFASEIARKESALERLRRDLRKNAGEYLGLSLSVYYDYAARGEARTGWGRQSAFFRVPRRAPASVRSCLESMRRDLRGRLGIPAAWP